MKIRTILILCLFSLEILAQQRSFSGTIIDKITKKPIEVVLLVLNSEIITYSNAMGEFNFELDLDNNDVEISLVHLSYNSKSFKLNKTFLNEKINIELIGRVNQLEEIVISKDSNSAISKKKILKETLKHFKDNFRSEPYWSSMNSKQIASIKDTPFKYLEVDGNIYMMGKNKNVFHTPIIVPSKVRTYESEFRKMTSTKISKNRNMSGHFLSYRFFEQFHPLSNKGFKHFDYYVEKTVFLKDEACYLISYKEKKAISKSGLGLNFMRGQLWVSTNDYSLKKLTNSFQLTNGIDNIFTIYYKELVKEIFPVRIYYKIKSLKYDFSFSGELTFVKISESPRHNYRSKYNLFNQHYFSNSEVYFSYDRKYWSTRSFVNSRYRDDVLKLIGPVKVDDAFEKWVNEFDKSSEQNNAHWKKDEELIIKIMKKDLNLN
ncbi:MAG: hypothetical protein IZT56_10015 [Bacteroidetes bacterium]|nr:hypothetical protein [Bacteroidota bacterium]